jgi:lactobin A/cerein 7B family class IIb bacteriocin
MLNNNELIEIKGGAINWAILGAAGAAITFIIGLIDGYVRPLKCHN